MLHDRANVLDGGVVVRLDECPDHPFPQRFLRVRCRQVLARLAHKLSREPDDVNLVLPYSEVIAALGYESERTLGLAGSSFVQLECNL